MHGCYICLNNLWYSILNFHKQQSYLHPGHVIDCSAFVTVVRKKETLLHYSPLPITTGRKKKKSIYHELLYLYYMQFNRQEKPFKKEEDYLHVAETKKSKSKYEEGYTIRDVTLHSLEILSFYYPSLQRIRQSCSTCEDEQKEKGMEK